MEMPLLPCTKQNKNGWVKLFVFKFHQMIWGGAYNIFCNNRNTFK